MIEARGRVVLFPGSVGGGRRWRAVALGGVLAGAACGGMDQPPTTSVFADSVDQVVYGVTHFTTMDGVRRLRLEADSAYVYQRAQMHHLFGVHVTFFSALGLETSSLTADEGDYYWRTGDMEARGHVVGVTPDGRRLVTSVLEYDGATDRIRGSEAFVYTEPNRELEGSAFTSDPDFRDIVATQPRGRVGQVERR